MEPSAGASRCVARTNVNGIDIVRFLVISQYRLPATPQGPRETGIVSVFGIKLSRCGLE